MSELKVGQEVFLRDTQGYTNKPQPITKTTITKVGNKYFTVAENWRGRVSIKTMLHDGGQYSSRFKVYLSKQEILDESLSVELIHKIRTIIGQYGKTDLTLEQMKQILNIIAP